MARKPTSKPKKELTQEDMEIAKLFHKNPDKVKEISKKYKVTESYAGCCWESWYYSELFPKSEAFRSLKENGLI